MDGEKRDIKSTILEELESKESGKSLGSVSKLSDVELPIRVEFSRVKKTIEEVISIAEGDVIKLERFAGEHIDLFVNDELFAKGEITVVDDRFGVRIVEILPREERLKI